MKETGSLRMPGVLEGTVGFVRRTERGELEVELYDFSEQAQEKLGGDIATIYTVRAEHLQQLAARLAERSAGEPASIEQVQCLLASFETVDSLIDWLTRESGVPFSKAVDFNA
jgi:hypothetical protein